MKEKSTATAEEGLSEYDLAIDDLFIACETILKLGVAESCAAYRAAGPEVQERIGATLSAITETQ